MADSTGIQKLIDAVKEEPPWLDEDIRQQYLELLDVFAWAEHCFFANESRSSRLMALLRFAEIIYPEALERLGWRVNAEGKYEQIRSSG